MACCMEAGVSSVLGSARLDEPRCRLQCIATVARRCRMGLRAVSCEPTPSLPAHMMAPPCAGQGRPIGPATLPSMGAVIQRLAWARFDARPGLTLFWVKFVWKHLPRYCFRRLSKAT